MFIRNAFISSTNSLEHFSLIVKNSIKSKLNLHIQISDSAFRYYQIHDEHNWA